MIYCDKISANGNEATYAAGSTSDNITGIIKISTDFDVEIIKQPKGEELSINAIAKLLSYHSEDVSKGVFKDQMNLEVY